MEPDVRPCPGDVKPLFIFFLCTTIHEPKKNESSRNEIRRTGETLNSLIPQTFVRNQELTYGRPTPPSFGLSLDISPIPCTYFVQIPRTT